MILEFTYFDYLLLRYYLFLIDQFKNFWTNFSLVVGGRIIYLFSFLLLNFVVLKKGGTPAPDSNKEGMANKLGNSSELNLRFWLIFILKEFLIVAIFMINEFLAIFMVAYSLFSAFRLLNAKNIKIPILVRLFKVFILLLIIVGFGYFALSLINGHINSIDIIALISPFILIPFFQKGLFSSGDSSDASQRSEEVSTPAEDFINYYLKKRVWMRISKKVKVILISAIILIPTTLYGLSLIRVVPSQHDYMVPMRDGVKLHTRVYFPAQWDGTPKPVILVRTPYNLENLESYAISYVVGKGYIMVSQDLRGTYGSEGDFYFFGTDYTDGNDTVNWVLEQPWCNGKIASIGGSALAINQALYHSAHPKGLKIASILVGTGEVYDYTLMNGGCIRQGLAENWANQVGVSNSTDVMAAHAIKDSFWENRSIVMGQKYKNIDVRAVHVGGFYDMFGQGTIDDYMLYNYNATDYAKGHQFLIMGPWSHYLSNKHLDIEYPDYGGLSRLSWCEDLLFNEYFNDNSSAIDWNTIPHVFYYVMGDPNGTGSGSVYNVWRNASTWPVPATLTPFYLHGNLTLSTSTPTTNINRSYIYDPRNPVRNGGGSTLTLDYIGAVDQRRVEYSQYYPPSYSGEFNTSNPRKDILKFDTATLTKDIEVVGRISAELYITSNCTDTDFTAKLIDIFPDGREMWVADGILKARYRNANNFESQELMTPNHMYHLSIDMWSTAYRFVAGHKIRLSISSSNYNKFAVNPNTGGPVRNTHPEDLINGLEQFYWANNTIVCGLSGNLSALWLPITN
ncbi:MAG: CocE/NonD family hydrolase [Promethearchaeota archaeon]